MSTLNARALSDPDVVRVGKSLAKVVGVSRVGHEVPFGAFTTFRVGGGAEWLAESRGFDETVRLLRMARQLGLSVTRLGGGSNVLVSDCGVRGLVIRLRHGVIELLNRGVVRVDAGVSLNGLVRWTIARGLAGVEAWAGTPGTVGGAIYGNAHFQGRLISEQILRVGVADGSGNTCEVDVSDMGFGYNESRLHQTGETVLWADFSVMSSASTALRTVALASLAYRKRTQPLSTLNAGCVFRNPDPTRVILPAGVPASAGALIERAGLKGFSVGYARVSEVHGNFIEGSGRVTAREIRSLIELCRERVRERFRITLQEELVYLGEF